MACFSPGFATRSKATRHFRVKLNAVINFMLRASAAEESVIWVALTSETNHGPKDTPQVLLGKASAESELPSGKSRGRRNRTSRARAGGRPTWAFGWPTGWPTGTPALRVGMAPALRMHPPCPSALEGWLCCSISKDRRREKNPSFQHWLPSSWKDAQLDRCQSIGPDVSSLMLLLGTQAKPETSLASWLRRQG
uniref:Uncharacterized protein n=1 Tax=Rangifer tarandus platyrhynchus TaxID=3082113 RepID=A0ACB0E9S1_RANTA|nr:unnamed protein product [Rangifer tarandus platyrhynchus]